MTWNTDISAAPTGRIVPVMRNTRKGKDVIRVMVREFEPDHVWLATKCGKVLKSYWIQSERNPGRWVGLASNELPVAWQPHVTPAHPNLSKPLVEAMTGAADHLFADGVGGQ